jgi:hypothetical protein
MLETSPAGVGRARRGVRADFEKNITVDYQPITGGD